MRLLVPGRTDREQSRGYSRITLLNPNQVLYTAACFLLLSIELLPIHFYLFLLYVNLKCHICSASIIAVLNDDSSVQWPILVNHNSLGRKKKKKIQHTQEWKAAIFLQLKLQTSGNYSILPPFKKEESSLQLEPAAVSNQDNSASLKEQQVLIQGGLCLTQLARVSLESTLFNAPHMVLYYIMIIMVIWQLMAAENPLLLLCPG